MNLSWTNSENIATSLIYGSFFFLNWNKVALQHCDSFCCTKWISYMRTYIPSLLDFPAHPHPVPLRHQRAPNQAPCVIQQALTSSLFYTWKSTYIDTSFPVLPPPCPQAHSLHLHLGHCPAHKSICTACLDSTCSLWHYFQSPGHGSKLSVYQQTNGLGKRGRYAQWNTTQPYNGMKLGHLYMEGPRV